MASRVMISPVIEPVPDRLISKAATYCDLAFINFFPSLASGRNASPWVLTIGRAVDWTAAAADPEIEFLFPIPANVDTADELRVYLRATTFGDLSAPVRAATQAVFDGHGINRADFTLATSLAQIMQRVASTLFEKDFNFGMGFRF
jgi:hypothetical protein